MRTNLNKAFKTYLFALIAMGIGMISFSIGMIFVIMDISELKHKITNIEQSMELSERPIIEQSETIEDEVLTFRESLDKAEQLEVLYLEKSKTYMDYKAIMDKKSEQYKLLQELIYTDDGYIQTDDGYIQTDDGYIAVALGSYFGDIGQKYILELTGGKILKVIKADEKSNTHTKDGYITTADGSVVEFIVDSEVMVKGSNGMPYNGNFNNNENFSGQIQTIYKIGK